MRWSVNKSVTTLEYVTELWKDPHGSLPTGTWGWLRLTDEGWELRIGGYHDGHSEIVGIVGDLDTSLVSAKRNAIKVLSSLGWE